MTPSRQRTIEEIRVRNLAEGTQEQYVGSVAQFARYFARSPAELGPDHVRRSFRQVADGLKAGNCWRIHIAGDLRVLYFKTLNVDWSMEDIQPPVVADVIWAESTAPRFRIETGTGQAAQRGWRRPR